MTCTWNQTRTSCKVNDILSSLAANQMTTEAVRVRFYKVDNQVCAAAIEFKKGRFSEYYSISRFRLAFFSVDGLHLTSWRPCWRYNTKKYVINSTVGSSRRGWLTLSATSREIDCKPRIFFVVRHKIGC